MLDWDSKFLQLVEDNKMTAYMYNRYVDDTTNGMKALAPGMRWGEDEKAMVFLPHLVDEDMEKAADERTMREVVRMGSSIDPSISIQLTDCSSINENGKMPALETQVWVEENKVMYEHFRKPMAYMLVMLEKSAMPAASANEEKCSDTRGCKYQKEHPS